MSFTVGKKINILTENHISTNRDYSQRAGPDKAQNSEIAKNFGFDYWDGERKTGYGGYKNDGRWKKIAEKLIAIYQLQANASILDIGCGKGFLLSELLNINSEFNLHGIDISSYALKNAEPNILKLLTQNSADKINFPEASFDLVIAMNVLHNLHLPELFTALQKIESIKKKDAYICVESYRNEREKWNLMQWQLTCECFFTPREWQWIFNQAGYTGDYEFIFFE